MLALQRQVGNAAAQQVLAREPAKPAADADAKGWEDLPFGSTIYKELIKEYTPEKLLKLALPHLKSLPEKLPEVEAKPVGLEGKETKQLAGGAASFAHKAAEEWMKTPEGKAWLDKAAGWAKQHPKTVYFTLLGAMAAAIAGAAVAYFTGNLDPPVLEKKFKALGFEITPGIDIGKFTETILQSAKLSISRELGQGISASISGDVADSAKTGWSGSAGARLGSKDVFGTYKLKWDEKGELGHGVGFGAYGLTGQYGWGKGDDTGKLDYKLNDQFTAGYAYQGGDKGFHSAELKLKPLIIPIETTAMVKFNADGSALLDASGLYKSASLGSYKLGVKGPLAGGKPDEAMVFTFGQSNKDAAGSTGSSEWTFNPIKPGGPVGKYDFSAGVYPGLTLAQKLTVGDGQVLAHETKLTGEALKGQIKADLAVGQNEAGAVTAGGGLTIKTEDAEWAVRAAFTDDQLNELAFKMGFGGKEDAVKFLVDASLQRKDGIDKASLKAVLTAKVGKFATKWEVSASTSEGGPKGYESAVGGGGAFTYLLPKGFLLGGAFNANYASKTGASVEPGILAGHEWSPVLLKGSVTVPVDGAGPPVWGLGAVGQF
jgi:hypothetical protein